MEISKALVTSMAKTLPIGYYAKRRIGITTNEEEQSSFYNPEEDAITISCTQVVNAMQTVDENLLTEEDVETLLRSNLYHEVSHAILTPQFGRMGFRIQPWLNIFEDERIERNLQTYYLDVDFVRSKFLMNGFKSTADIPTPTDAQQAFYSLVRFGCWGNEQLFSEKERIYSTYKHLDALNGKDGWDWTTRQYYNDVRRLWEQVCDLFNTDPNQSNQQSGQPTQCPSGSSNNQLGQSKQLTEMNQNDGQSAQSQTATGEKSENAEGSHEKSDMSCDSDNISADAHDGNDVWDDKFRKVVNSVYDESLTNVLTTIISSFNKKTNSGSATTGYSGVLNPRLVGRKDYRFFERKSEGQGQNKYGTFHLNLFLDVSGSFSPNEQKTNALLSSLASIERKYKSFTFDVVFCGEGQTIAKKGKRQIKCDYGNNLTEEIFGQYRTLQKPNTYNYNIVLFDGRASYGSGDKNFGAFNHNNVFIMSDGDNEYAIKTYAPSARSVIVKDGNYVNILTDNVTKALQSAFR